jgi:hypothetical protein
MFYNQSPLKNKWLEGLSKLKNPRILLGFEPATFWLEV